MNLDKFFDEDALFDSVDFDAIAAKADEVIDAQEDLDDDTDCEGCKI